MIKRVLLADDDADDIQLFKEVFADLPAKEYVLVTAQKRRRSDQLFK
jgi:hypothetical protein